MRFFPSGFSRLFFLLLGGLLSLATPAWAQFTLSGDRPTGVYHVGDTATWTLEWKGTGAAPVAQYSVKRGGLTELARGDLTVNANNVAQFTSTFDRPDTVLVEVSWGSPVTRVYGGAVAAPEQIQPADTAEPADFEAFWRSKLEELAAVPENAQVEPADSGRAGVTYAKVTLDNIRGTKIRAQLARPATTGRFPALLILQWAGVYRLEKPWVTDRAAEGWLTLNVNPHDLPIDEPAAFYEQQYAGPLSNYWRIGNDDRDTSYYLRMYLSCFRAIEYLRSRPDWDGKTLVVMGTSQGGQQTFAALGLHPEGITAGLVLVPAAADMLAPSIGRRSGFPEWYTQTAGRDPAKVRTASRYYDPVHFARRIRAPMLIGAALYDELAPPSSVLAEANVMTAPRELVLMQASHNDINGSQGAWITRTYRDWLPALRRGEAPPLVPYPTRLDQVPVASGSASAQILNLSTRGVVGTGENALIAGFAIAGSASKQLLVLASGANLRKFGLTGEIGRPHLTVYRNVNGTNVAIAENSDWQEHGNAITPLAAQVYAQPFSASSDPAHGDAGLVLTVEPGTYSAVVSPDAKSANTDGIGLVELYDVTPNDGSRLINISSRGLADRGARQMVVGVSVGGTGETRLLFRGAGPALSPFGITQYVRNPTQTLYQNVAGTQTVVTTNDDWWLSPQSDQASALTPRVGGFPLGAYSADSALLRRVGPGTYTVIISPADGPSGIALAELYEANDPR